MFYKPGPLDGYPCINAIDADDYEAFLELDGTPRGSSWKPVAVRQVAMRDEADAFLPSNFPWLSGHALVLDEQALNALRDLIEPFNEVLPLNDVGRGRLFVLNTRTIDALDEEHSKLLRFPNGRIMQVRQPVFRDVQLAGATMFRLPHRSTPTYVSEAFVRAVETAGLKGLRFDRVG